MSENIGFIGGGQMGEALIKGLINAGTYKSTNILVAEPNSERCSYLEQSYSVKTFEKAETLWQECQTIILAVKPQVMGSVLKQSSSFITENHLLITIAAGLPLSFYQENAGFTPLRIIRVMPNTPALVMEGVSALCRGQGVTDNDMIKGEAILNAVGKTVVIDEHLMDAVTGLSGSGPAYVFSFIEALIDAGVQSGLSGDVASMLVTQTVLGSVKLLEESKEHPAVLRSRVTSPGGTTIAALHTLETNGFNGIIMDAVKAAVDRSVELGKK